MVLGVQDGLEQASGVWTWAGAASGSSARSGATAGALGVG